MGLKIKISSGYILLILLLAVVIYLFNGERVKQDTLKKEESELAAMRKLTAEAYMSLLDLSSRAEVAGAWTDDDYDAYHARQETVLKTLEALRHHIHTPEQLARIDSFNILLNEKGQLLSVIMNTLDEATDVSGIINEKIPVIVSRIQKAPVQEIKEAPVPESKQETGKKKGIWGIFRRKETKSAYLRQREQAAAPQKETDEAKERNTNGPPIAVPLLRSLDREVVEKQKAQREKLLLQMDSLYENSQTLNRKLNTLVEDFEKETGRHLSSGYEALIADREDSFRAASWLAAFVFLLAAVLYIIVHRDVNKRYRYEQALEIADETNRNLLQSRKNMMMTIAHDLRAPLSTIRGCAELLPGEKEKSRRDAYAENILHTSDYMLGLVNTLMEFYMLDTGRVKLNMTVFSLENLFNETTGNFGSLAGKKNLSLTTGFAGLGAVVSGDRQRIQQIVNNLLSNALKFTRQGGIRLNAEYNNEELRFSVRDTGPGMTTEEKGRIFGPFEQLDNARDTPGFGLGLAICSRLVSRMGGTIAVESGPGEGSAFTVSMPLPLADGRSRMEEEHGCPYSSLEGINVLVIDDDRVQLNVTGDMLNRNGIKCDCCLSSRELIDKLKSRKYDLLLTDIQMPGTDGYGILELLRASNIEAAKQIPVIAVTARVDDESNYISCGFSGCIHKPFSTNELMKGMAQVVGKAGKKRKEPDFTTILSDEDDKRGMLTLFITESRKDLAALDKALQRRDKAASAAILHKNLPLWQSVRLDFPLPLLRELVTCDSDAWTDGQVADIRKIIRAVDKLIGYAEKLREAEP